MNYYFLVYAYFIRIQMIEPLKCVLGNNRCVSIYLQTIFTVKNNSYFYIDCCVNCSN